MNSALLICHFLQTTIVNVMPMASGSKMRLQVWNPTVFEKLEHDTHTWQNDIIMRALTNVASQTPEHGPTREGHAMQRCVECDGGEFPKSSTM